MVENHPLSTELPSFEVGNYTASKADMSQRVFLPEIMESLGDSNLEMVDVRSAAEFSGEILAPPGLAETCQRGGHIPGVTNIGWATAANEDGSFKTREELEKVFFSKGVTPEKEVFTYCRIGERSSYSWFVLKYLLGFEKVRNYDGSWTEWGNLVAVPIEK